MDYTQLLNELNQATLFDLYRLSVAINKQLDNPERNAQIKRALKVGMELSYFDAVDNRLVKAKLLAMKQKNAVVLNPEQNARFRIPYYMLNIDDADTDIYESRNAGSLTANNLKVGDCVGFNAKGEDIAGVIKRINHKTVTLDTNTGSEWRVAYRCLHRIHDADRDRSIITSELLY